VIRFTDETIIEVSSGKGGNGCVAFRREKYVPNGGPAGGDGGRGGDVIFCVKRNLRTLSHLRHKPVFRARNGGDGEGSNRHGKDGEDVIVNVPPGTIVSDAVTGERCFEWSTDTEGVQAVFLTGGKGGKGNTHFKSSVNQAPRNAKPGQPGETRRLKIELNIVADLGLVGFPNAGKSSLLNDWTNARPKIAPYPFTTKIPNLGVLAADRRQDDQSRDIVIADIPGIIEGASEGIGLGFRFLRHISRTMALLFIIDAAEETAQGAYDALRRELASFSGDLAAKPHLVLCNKTDLEGAPERAEQIRRAITAAHPEVPVFAGSVLTGRGMKAVMAAVRQMAGGLPGALPEGEKTSAGDAPQAQSAFLAGRAFCGDGDTQFPGT
jgi:GTP-binding protein